MVPEKLPDSYPGKSCSGRPRQEFWQRANGELQVVDLRQALDREADRRNGPVYFPQDTHWNFAGGLTMVRELAERLQPGVTSTWKSNLGPQSTLTSDLPPMIGKTGTNRSIMYGLLPDGTTDRTNFTNLDFNQTLAYDTPPLTGMIDTPATMFADSFTQFAAPYLAAAFNRMSITHLATLQKNPRAIANSVPYGNTVIVEVVERNLASGISTISDPTVVDALVEAVRAHPLR
jgi:alginate O-acetyltransferase complex protein AlgJ